MTTQEIGDYKRLKSRLGIYSTPDEFDLGLSTKISRIGCTWSEILQGFELFQMNQVKKIELLREEGLRLYTTIPSSLISEKTVQIFRKLLESIMKTPISVYWNTNHLDFVPL